MSFTFNGTPSAEVSISGDVAVENPLKNLKTIYYDGTSTLSSSVPVGKYWIVVGVGGRDHSVEGSIYASIGTGAIIRLMNKLGTPEFFTDYATLPLRFDAGDSIVINEDGMFSYYEFDI